jgi:tRNA (mo5U34)-methyltransferase
MKYKSLSPEEIKEMAAINWWHTIPVGWDEKKTIIYTPGKVDSYNHREFGIPDDLAGKTVLDIGAWDGYFTWTCEKLGADVTSIDTTREDGGNWGGTRGYEFCRKILDAKARLIYPLSIYDLPDEMHNQFDLVLNFGVIYHLHNPMMALEKTFRATKPGGMAIFETAYDCRNSRWGASLWSLWPDHDEDPTNFFYPTIEGLKNALKIYGFIDCRIHVIRTRRNYFQKAGRLVMIARKPG